LGGVRRIRGEERHKFRMCPIYHRHYACEKPNHKLWRKKHCDIKLQKVLKPAEGGKSKHIAG